LWGGGVLVLGGYMLGEHTAPLQEQAVERQLEPQDHWQAEHYLATGCPCSRQVADDLIENPPLHGLQHVYVLGEDAKLVSRLQEAGYQVTTLISEAQLKEHGVVGGPWLRVYEPSGELAYSGGYAPVRPTIITPAHASELIDRIIDGSVDKALPAYGCAASGL